MMLWFVWLQENVESSGDVWERLPDGALDPFEKGIMLLSAFVLVLLDSMNLTVYKNRALSWPKLPVYDRLLPQMKLL